VAGELVSLIENTSGDADAADLRDAAIQALAPLRFPGMLRLADRLLNARESARARIAALRGLGELGDPNAADLVVDRLGQEREPSVRLEGLTALSKVGGLEYAQVFLRYMDNREPDQSVREWARQLFRTLLAGANERQLRDLPGIFRNDLDMRIAVLQALTARLEQRGNLEDLALQRQNIGVDYLKLGKPAEAVPYLQKAIEYHEKQNAQGPALESLIGQMMDALLQSRQYAQAAAFGARTLGRDPSQQGTIGPKIKNEADRLQGAGRPDDALALIGEALRMNPSLADRYVAQLREIREQAQQQQKSSGSPAGAASGQ
jgi:tetratricopeptide (TPR) repeat protein